ncbi:hypothetical protein QR680_016425 [Steinernema hermaphroditum]|uniref:Aminopeptidase n=1 Tax=Steinernema hermaphroditum TaxID=289476 RepID=A0AA39HBI4_9BILA|nr:hypothetical protein QR680_016425 [Steinernema hermaphroditum]
MLSSLLLIAAVVLPLSCCAESNTTFHRLPDFAKPLHYRIYIKPDLENSTFEGTAVIDVLLTEPTDHVVLHSLVNITEASYLLANSSEQSSTYEVLEEASMWRFNFSELMNDDTRVVLNISFNGTISRGKDGVYYGIERTENETSRFVTTQFESTYARKAFPCWDEPAFKALFTISLEVDADLTALSNGAVAHEKYIGDKKVVTFETTPPMSTYLVAFAIGDFEYLEDKVKDGPLVRMYTIPGKVSLMEKALAHHVKAFEYFSRVFDYPYPMKKIDGIAVPHFGAGGMENWGLILYNERFLFDDDVDVNSLIYAISVVGHEVAHFWFGNLVTMKWWNDLWLKEGLATFLAYQFIEDNYPEHMPWDFFIGMLLDMAQDVDHLKGSHPIRISVDDQNQLPRYYDAITYKKSAHLIRMLYHHVGKDNFWSALSLYLKRHEYGSTETSDLWQAFKDATGKVGRLLDVELRGVGKDVERLMSIWTTQTGYPFLTVSFNTKTRGTAMTISQKRFLASGEIDSTSDPWLLPLQILVAKNNTNATYSLLYPDEEQLLPSEDVASSDFFQINPEHSGYFHVKYDAAEFRNLLKAYQENSDIDDFLDLIKSSGNEDSFVVLSAIDDALFPIPRWLQEAEEYELVDKYYRFITTIFKASSQKIGWRREPQEDLQTTYTRYYFKNIMILANDSETITEAKECVKLSVASSKEGARRLFELYKNGGKAADSDSYLIALACSQDAETVEEVMHYVVQKENKTNHDLAIFMRYAGYTPQGEKIAWDYVNENWNTTKVKVTSPARMLSDLLSYSGRLSLYEDAMLLLSKEEKEKNKDLLERMQEKLTINGRQHRLHRDRLSQWLSKNGY